MRTAPGCHGGRSCPREVPQAGGRVRGHSQVPSVSPGGEDGKPPPHTHIPSESCSEAQISPGPGHTREKDSTPPRAPPAGALSPDRSAPLPVRLGWSPEPQGDAQRTWGHRDRHLSGLFLWRRPREPRGKPGQPLPPRHSRPGLSACGSSLGPCRKGGAGVRQGDGGPRSQSSLFCPDPSRASIAWPASWHERATGLSDSWTRGVMLMLLLALTLGERRGRSQRHPRTGFQPLPLCAAGRSSRDLRGPSSKSLPECGSGAGREAQQTCTGCFWSSAAQEESWEQRRGGQRAEGTGTPGQVLGQSFLRSSTPSPWGRGYGLCPVS